MRSLKILSSLIGLFMAFSITNVGAMENSAYNEYQKDKNEMKVDGNELDKTGEKCSIFLYAGYENKEVKDKYLKVKTNIEEKIIRNRNLCFNDLAFDYTPKDLYEFYKKLYNEVLAGSKKFFNLIKRDKYFTLFNPEKLKNISFKDKDGANEILLEFKKDITFSNTEHKTLQNLKLKGKHCADLVSCGSYGVAMLKQIVLIYIEFAENKKKEEINVEKVDYKYVNGKVNLDSDCLSDQYMEEKMKELVFGENTLEQWWKKGVTFDGSSKDLRGFYEQAYNMIVGKNIVFIKSMDLVLFMFDPENVKDITLKNDGSNAVFKFDVMNIKKSYDYFKKINSNIYCGFNSVDEIFKDVDSIIENAYSSIFPKQIILTYIKCLKEKREKMKKLEKAKLETGKGKEVKDLLEKEYKISLTYDSKFKLVDKAAIEKIIESTVLEAIKGRNFKYNCTFEDLLEFYKTVNSRFVEKKQEKPLIVCKSFDGDSLFDPENIEYIQIADNGLNAVFKFNVKNVKDRFGDKTEYLIPFLKCFDSLYKFEYRVEIVKQIISIYIKFAKEKKEEMNNSEIKKGKELLKKEYKISLTSDNKYKSNDMAYMDDIIKATVLKVIKDKKFKYNCTFKDLLEFYKTVISRFSNNKREESFVIYKIFSEDSLFDPENIEDIKITDYGTKVIFKFNVEKVIDRFGNKMEHLISFLNNFDFMDKWDNMIAVIKQIILIYIDLVENRIEIKNLEKEKEKELLEKEYKMLLISDNRYKAKDTAIRENIRPEVLKAIEGKNLKFNCTPEDLLQYYIAVSNRFSNGGQENPFLIFKSFNGDSIFDPENIEDIKITDEGLNAVFKFNVEKVIDRFGDKTECLVIPFLKHFDSLYKLDYRGVVVKQIILIYLECVKEKREEMKKLEIEKKKDRKEIIKKVAEKKEEEKKKEINMEEDKKGCKKEENVNKEELNKEEYKENFEKDEEENNREKNNEGDKKEDKK